MSKRLCAALILVLCGNSLLADDWPQFRGPNRDGISAEKGLLKKWPQGGPKLLWSTDQLGTGYSGPAIVGDTIYIAGTKENRECTFAINAKDGKVAWTGDLGPVFTWRGNSWNAGPNASPTVGQQVIVQGGFGDLVCYQKTDGKVLWQKNLPKDLAGEVNPIGGGLDEPTPLGWGYAAAPLIVGETVICVPGGKNGLLAALDLKSGKVLWQSKTITDQAPYAAPVLAKIHDTLTIVVVTNQGIYGVLPKSGEELFRYTRNEPYDDVVISTPIVGNNRVFTSVGFGQGCDFIELVRTAGNPRISTIMSNKLVQNRDGSMVLVNNHLYGHSENQGWFCLDFATGKLKWNDRTALERGSVAYADGKLYCLGEKGNVVLAEATPEGWSETSRFRLPKASSKRLPSGAVWTNPVIADGKLYLRDQEFLYCYAIK